MIQLVMDSDLSMTFFYIYGNWKLYVIEKCIFHTLFTSIQGMIETLCVQLDICNSELVAWIDTLLFLIYEWALKI